MTFKTLVTLITDQRRITYRLLESRDSPSDFIANLHQLRYLFDSQNKKKKPLHPL